MKYAKSIALLAGVVTALIAQPASANALQDIQQRGELRVATDM